ncbi:hypothetical protein TRIUR3_34970 [Triticum urartu]|uniref:Uncharacterized protein n=1 Tax=Triticum urartu TaxID=4572 RepID=M7YDU3_TRIUA|nr:hypothetical protein TRIUR3_34970 [Triticum urartu]
MAFDSNHERLRALKAFDETKAGLKGLVDAGITAIPAIFHHPPESFAPLAPFSTDVAIPVIDLSGQRSEVVSKVKAAMEKLGFFLVVNHGVPEAAMSNMLSVVRGFHEEPVEAKELYYTRDEERHVKYSGNADLFRSPAAKWRDTMYINDADRLAEEILPPCLRLWGCSVDIYMEEETGCLEALPLGCHYYPACPEPHLTLGAVKHSDASFLTVVLRPQIVGGVLLQGEYGNVVCAGGRRRERSTTVQDYQGRAAVRFVQDNAQVGLIISNCARLLEALMNTI